MAGYPTSITHTVTTQYQYGQYPLGVAAAWNFSPSTAPGPVKRPPPSVRTTPNGCGGGGGGGCENKSNPVVVPPRATVSHLEAQPMAAPPMDPKTALSNATPDQESDADSDSESESESDSDSNSDKAVLDPKTQAYVDQLRKMVDRGAPVNITYIPETIVIDDDNDPFQDDDDDVVFQYASPPAKRIKTEPQSPTMIKPEPPSSPMVKVEAPCSPTTMKVEPPSSPNVKAKPTTKAEAIAAAAANAEESKSDKLTKKRKERTRDPNKKQRQQKGRRAAVAWTPEMQRSYVEGCLKWKLGLFSPSSNSSGSVLGGKRQRGGNNWSGLLNLFKHQYPQFQWQPPGMSERDARRILQNRFRTFNDVVRTKCAVNGFYTDDVWIAVCRKRLTEIGTSYTQSTSRVYRSSPAVMADWRKGGFRDDIKILKERQIEADRKYEDDGDDDDEEPSESTKAARLARDAKWEAEEEEERQELERLRKIKTTNPEEWRSIIERDTLLFQRYPSLRDEEDKEGKRDEDGDAPMEQASTEIPKSALVTLDEQCPATTTSQTSTASAASVRAAQRPVSKQTFITSAEGYVSAAVAKQPRKQISMTSEDSAVTKSIAIRNSGFSIPTLMPAPRPMDQAFAQLERSEREKQSDDTTNIEAIADTMRQLYS